MGKDYFESFYGEYLEFKSKLGGKIQQIENKSDYENQILKNKINHLEQEIINLKKINEDLKSDTKSHLKMTETLSEGNRIVAPWKTNSFKRINNSNRTILPACKVNNKNPSGISLHNPYEILDDTSEQEVDTITDTTETKRRKVRSNRINRVSVRKEQRYDDSDHQINFPQKIAPGNETYVSATNYGEGAIVFGDSHLRRIVRKLFNESLPNCRGSFKYFSGTKTLDLEHYMKPSLNNNRPDAVVIHIGLNDVGFINLRHLAKILPKILPKLLYYVKNMEQVKLLSLRFYPKEILNCQS